MFPRSAKLPVAAALIASGLAAQYSASSYALPGAPAGLRGRAVQVVDQDFGGTDIVVGASNGTDDIVFRRTGPSLAAWTVIDSYTGGGLTDLKVAALDNVSTRDVVTANAAGNYLRVRLLPGGAATITLPAAFSAQKVEAVDIDNDGDLDLATVGWGHASIHYAQNSGAGVFPAVASAVVPSVAPSRPQCFTAGDFNHDGKIDFIVPRGDGHSSYFRNTTVGSSVSFAAPQTYPNANTRPFDVCADDFNGDGWLDFATADGIGSCSVFLNQGPPIAGSWTAVNFTKTVYTLGTPNALPRAICSGQYDCDGDVDLFVALTGYNQIAVLQNNGAGSFVSFTPATPVGPAPYDIDGGDLDGDRDFDLATADYGGAVGSSTHWTRSGAPTLQMHIYEGGIADGLSAATPAGIEDACPQPGAFTAFLAPNRNFDESSCTRKFGHTFPSVAASYQLPADIQEARLTIRMRGDCANANDDTIGFGFSTGPDRMVFQRAILDMPGVTTYTTGTWVGFSIDLANLPDGSNLLPKINADRYLDVLVEDATQVDYIGLQLRSCVKYRCEFSQKQSPLVAGSSWTIAAGGAPAGSFIFFFMSPTVGAGPVLPGGMFSLLPPYSLLGVQFAPAGSASLSTTLPGVLPGPGITVSTQSISFPSWCYSNTWTAQLYN